MVPTARVRRCARSGPPTDTAVIAVHHCHTHQRFCRTRTSPTGRVITSTLATLGRVGWAFAKGFAEEVARNAEAERERRRRERGPGASGRGAGAGGKG